MRARIRIRKPEGVASESRRWVRARASGYAAPPARVSRILGGAGTFWILVGLAIAAVALRVWSLLSLGADLRVGEPIIDGRYYLELGTLLGQGGAWPAGPVFMSPLLPAVLSVLFRVASATAHSVHVFHSVLGLATGVLLYLSACRDLGRAPALGALALYVLAGPLLAIESQVLNEPLLLFFASAAVWFWPDARTQRLGGVAFGIPFGVAVGLLTIGRGAFAILLAPVLWTAIVRRRSTMLRTTAWTLVGFSIAILPLAWHQTRATGHFETLALNGGLNLYVGNNPAARGIYSLPRGIDLESDITGARAASTLAGRSLTLRESSSYFTERAAHFLTSEPKRAAWLLSRKTLLFLSPKEIPQIEDFQILREEHVPLRIAFIDFAWLLPLAVLGLASNRSNTSRRLTPWLCLIAIGWLSTIVFFATGRFRIPIWIGFLGAGGLGIQTLLEIAQRKRSPRWLALPAGVAFALFALPTYPETAARAFDRYQLGLRHARAGQTAAALASYEEATKLAPDDAVAWHGVGTALVQLGRLPEAVDAYQRAIERNPESALTRYNLAITHARTGREDLALAQFEAAARLDPFDPAIRSDYGVALFRAGQHEAAIAAWKEALRLRPGFAPALRGLEAAGVR